MALPSGKLLVRMLVGFLVTRPCESSFWIKWAKFPAARLVLMPKDFIGSIRNSNSSQTLTIGNLPDEIAMHRAPSFSVSLDKTITWTAMGRLHKPLCMEASGDRNGDAVRLNVCTGGAGQRWNWIPIDHRRNMVQLKDSQLCLDVMPHEDGLNGASIGLRECNFMARQSWNFEESIALLERRRSAPSFALVHLVIQLIVVLGLAVLSLGIWCSFSPAKDCPMPTKHGSNPLNVGPKSDASVISSFGTQEGSLANHMQSNGMLQISRAGFVRSVAALSTVATSVPASALSDKGTPAGSFLYNTSTKSFTSAEPRHITLALKQHPGGIPRVIFVGEVHTNPLHHKYQLDVLKAIDRLDDAPTWIGLEMCYRQQQHALDAFVYDDSANGGGSIELLSERTQWASTWGFPIELYAGVLHYARERRLRLCGLNVPRPVVSEVGKHGLNSLSEGVRSRLPDLDLGNKEHFQRFKKNIDMIHTLSQEQLQFYYEAQTLWDEYMASSIAGYLSPYPPGSVVDAVLAKTGRERMVVLVGKSHVQGRVGIPDRVTKRTGLRTFTILPVTVPAPATGTAGILDIRQPLPSSEADCVLYTLGFEAEQV